MSDFNRKEHWETIYSIKKLEEVSWYQPIPDTALDFIERFTIPQDAAIIDIGAGDSFFVDELLKRNYTDISVLDISENALKRAQERLGGQAKSVHWINTDIVEFNPQREYDFWYDRAAFHFLTEEKEIQLYIITLQKALKETGIAIIGTFSETGPKKCSGIEITQYSEQKLHDYFDKDFNITDIIHLEHNTPFGTTQNFIFCVLKRK